MRWLITSYLSIVCAFVSCGWLAAYAGEPSPQGETVDRLRGVIVHAKDFFEAGEACNKLFRRLDKQQLREWSRDTNIGIALAAYAELHGNLVPRANSRAEHLKLLYGRLSGGLPEVDRESLPEHVRDPLDAQRFLGFLEARTGLQVPRWWEEAYQEQYTCGIFEYQESSVLGFLEVPIGLSLRETNGRIVVRRGDSSFSVPKPVVDKVDSEQLFQRCTATIKGDTGVVAFFDGPGSCFLFCVKNNTLQWSAEAWNYGAPNRIGVTGPWTHDLEVSIQEKCVAVFGTGTGGAYVEAFDKKTGANIFRFSQTYWLQKRPWTWD